MHGRARVARLVDPAHVFVFNDMIRDEVEHGRRKAEADRLSTELGHAMHDAIMPDLKSIICAFTRRAGGADGIAKMLLREYRDAKPGTMIRAMVLQMILQGSKAVSAKEQSRDASMISDEDLQKELEAIMSQVPNAGKYAGVADGIQPGAQAGTTP